ncbi:MAG: hypothetical protein ACRDL7_08360, partial [Gaiellaceae bacterium]
YGGNWYGQSHLFQRIRDREIILQNSAQRSAPPQQPSRRLREGFCEMCIKSSANVEDYKTITGPSVVLIGCGPGGMSVLHALEFRKQGIDPTSAEYAALPHITCYERGPGPGGVWREVPEDDKERKRPENYKLQ